MTSVERIREKHLPSRVAGRRSRNLVAAIEGTIVATAVVATIDANDAGSSARAFWIILATGTFFWIAHVYADLLAARIKGHHRMKRPDVAHVLHREWPLLQASLLLAVPLALGALDLIDDGAALDLSMAVGVAALFGWGVVFARREGHGLAGIIGAASLNATVGLVIVGLKVVVR
jgi:hypothetical protein